MVLKTGKLIFASWPGFIFVAFLTQLLYLQFYAVKFRVTILLTLTAINFLQGLFILMDARLTRRKTLIVTSAFIAAQWWFFMWLLIFMMWSIDGFAP